MSLFVSQDTGDGTHSLYNMQMPTNTDVPGGLPPIVIAAFRFISDELVQVKKLINQQLLCCPDKADVRQLVEHLNSSGGKMIRPGLVLLSGGAVGEVTDKHIRIAAIMEMIHNATLLHDDVIDEGQKRCGGAR